MQAIQFYHEFNTAFSPMLMIENESINNFKSKQKTTIHFLHFLI